jgi:RNA polymerase sigma-70 factor (sigma-E family)
MAAMRPAAAAAAGDGDSAVPSIVLTSTTEDRRAEYATCFAAHGPRLTRIALLLTGDVHQADDVVAEAFARAWPRWRRGGIENEGAYLTRAVVNEVTSAGRRIARAARLDGRLQATAHTAATATGGVTGPSVDRESERIAMLAALRALPGRQRAVVVLRFYGDLTEAQTAELLGMRIGTVKSQTARALARLRTLLEEADADA